MATGPWPPRAPSQLASVGKFCLGTLLHAQYNLVRRWRRRPGAEATCAYFSRPTGNPVMACSTAKRAREAKGSSSGGNLLGPPSSGDLGVSSSDFGRPEGRKSVYVVRLSRMALGKKKFRRANPSYSGEGLCLYVGMTGHSPERRFEKHKAGHKSSWWVEEFGTGLIPELYAPLNRMNRETALIVEERLAECLRARGHAVWQN